MDWIWITVLCVLHVCFLVINLRLLFYFEHPDDSKYNQGLLAKLMVLLGLQLAWLVVSSLPVDAHVAQIKSSANIETFWEIVFLFIIVYMALPFPAALFYYEADSDPRVSKTAPWKKALIYTAIVFMCVAAVVGVGYAITAPAKIPSREINCLNKYLTDSLRLACAGGSNAPRLIPSTTPYLMYQINISAFIGYWGFVLFEGVGLAALPVSLIVGFIDRPKAIDFGTYSEKKRQLGEKAFYLHHSGEGLKRNKMEAQSISGLAGYRKRLRLDQDVRKFRQSVFLLEQEYQDLNMAYVQRGENPVISYAKLFAGIGCAGMSLMWMVQIILAVIVPQLAGVVIWNFDDFLVLVKSVEFFALDLVLYGFMVCYLLLCVIVGCFKYGLRVFICFPIIPMRKADTHLNRFLLNVAVIVLASAAVAHFSAISFPKYSTNTAAEVIF
eukprot:GHVN01064613.1.p1 GENE.GHVN01064613.1~~GHVN01064613.1.p1  ORF type:complete len:440 (-),score=49.97 GHVN01064613.1:809-2128(-)